MTRGGAVGQTYVSAVRGRKTDGRLQASRALPLPAEAQALLDDLPRYVESLGPLGPLFFFGVFVLLECLSLPATPLMLSSGYLFGLLGGVVLSISALTTAATISFFLARTVLRPQVGELLAGNETVKNINRAVEREGFKIMVLLRMTPLLPFALSNYMYGLSNVDFKEYFFATVFGTMPGTCAFVYFATVARSAADGAEDGTPWYTYAASIALTVVFLKLVADTAKKAVDEAVAAESGGNEPSAGDNEGSSVTVR